MEFRHYVALGDSILSDDYPGPNQGAAALLFRNRDDLFPEFRERDLSRRYPGMRFIQTTRSGYTCEDVLQTVRSLPSGPEPTLVVLTVGGNDLLRGIHVATIVERLDRLREALRKRLPQHRLLIGNVYDPTDGTGMVQSSQRRGAPPLREALEGLRQLNQALPGPVVDLHSHFLGHGMRHHDRSYEHYHADDPSGWFQFDIEPNPRGASEVRRCFWEALLG